MNNIAVVRNPDTLQILGFAPIYDSGNSMFYDIPYEALSRMRIDDIKTHSFVEKESRLLQYVQNRSLVDIDRADMDFSIYEMEVVERRIRIPKFTPADTCLLHKQIYANQHLARFRERASQKNPAVLEQQDFFITLLRYFSKFSICY